MSTLKCAETLSYPKETTISLIKSFAFTCAKAISEKFSDWFQAPLNLATINDPESAERLVKYCLNGFRNNQVYSLNYTTGVCYGAKLATFPELYKWWIVTFGSLSVHNIDCERGFSVMRYIHRSKLSAGTELESYLVQHAFDEKMPERSDYINGLLVDNLDEEKLVQMIAEAYEVMDEGTADEILADSLKFVSR